MTEKAARGSVLAVFAHPDDAEIAAGGTLAKWAATGRDVHLLVLPRRHVDTFRDVDAFPEGEAARMLRFIADTARAAGLEDYRVLVNVGPGAGQTIFHLHWHVLGGNVDAERVAQALSVEAT